jgi:hypothetical protein
VGAQSGEISGGDDGEVEILREMMGNAIGAVEPGSAHGAGLGLRFSVHEMIDDERAIGLGEELGEADRACGCVPDVEVARAFLELVILNGSALREMAAQLGDAFALTHEFDFGEAKLLPFGKIFGRFVGQIGLSKCSVNRCVYHRSLFPRVIFSPAARRRNRRAFPGLARVFYQVKTPAISVDEFSEFLINAQVQPTRKGGPGKLESPLERAVDYGRITGPQTRHDP